MKKNILLLIQLGTPKSPSPKDVGLFLKEFLMDPHVIDLPFLVRWILVHLLIVPRRKYKSSKSYKLIWQKNGSPLFIHSKNFAQGVRNVLKDEWKVELAMRYGEPSIFKTLKKLKDDLNGQNKVYVQSLYPHHTLSSVESARSEVLTQASKLNLEKIKFHFLPEFYNKDFFIQPLFEKIKKHLLNYKEKANETLDHLIFSYHGLPKRHIRKLDPKKLCNFNSCCKSLIHPKCYRAQCFKTTSMLCQLLNWDPQKSSTSFQSRLLFNWIEPYTLNQIQELKRKGIKKIAVITPSFTADCLETLEEVEIQMKSEFLSKASRFSFFSSKEKKSNQEKNVKSQKPLRLSNLQDSLQESRKTFYRIPCLNDDKSFVTQFASYIESQKTCIF